MRTHPPQWIHTDTPPSSSDFQKLDRDSDGFLLMFCGILSYLCLIWIVVIGFRLGLTLDYVPGLFLIVAVSGITIMMA